MAQWDFFGWAKALAVAGATSVGHASAIALDSASALSLSGDSQIPPPLHYRTDHRFPDHDCISYLQKD